MAESNKVLTRTADLSVKLTAETLPNLFKTGLLNLNKLLFSYQRSPTYGTARITENIHLNSKDVTALLVDFMSEALTLSQNRLAVFYDLKIDKMTDHQLSGIVKGTPNIFPDNIKTMTLNECKVELNENGNWEATIVINEL